MAEFDTRLQRGSRVYAGQPIGRMGMTGNATGVHLHYEVFVDGLLVDPMYYGRPPTYVSAPAPDIAYLPNEEPVEGDKPID
jgi:murein DD-endopeptidase MepM/ murein hydrolase activator NlpD